MPMRAESTMSLPRYVYALQLVRYLESSESEETDAGRQSRGIRGSNIHADNSDTSGAVHNYLRELSSSFAEESVSDSVDRYRSEQSGVTKVIDVVESAVTRPGESLDDLLIFPDGWQNLNYSPEEWQKLNFSAELMCRLKEHEPPLQGGGCPTYWDTLLCWPATPPNMTAVLPCFEELEGIKYDTSQNASRWCHPNGTWDNYTDYTACRDMHPGNSTLEAGIEITSYIYYGGYTLSLVALALAVWIFLYFKDLRCLRNIIHTNLMCTYMMAAILWILTLKLQLDTTPNYTSCVFLLIFLHYFHLTNFFWMLVEGLYLYMLVVETFTRENIKLRVYILIGWGGPAVFITIWAIVKSVYPLYETGDKPEPVSAVDPHCPLMHDHAFDWLYKAPAIAVLIINFLFLVMIMWVLITKLRSATNMETQQYRKASKALLVLIPLLGITYILFIMGPSEGVSKKIFDHARAILLSTQGFTVALFYCFLNTEVQNTLRHHLERWKTARSLGGSRRYQYSGHSKDWSPRSRTESIRLNSLHSQPTHGHRGKRESTTSETTTTTLIGGTAYPGYCPQGANATTRTAAPNHVQIRATSISPFLQPGVDENAV